MGVETSARLLLRILEALAFMFDSSGGTTFQVTEGGSTSVHIPYDQGQPTITDSDLDSVAITFFTGSSGSGTRAGTTTIGDTGHTMTLAQILTVAHDATNDRMTLTFDVSAVEFPDDPVAAQTNIYFELSVVQPDP